MKRPNKEEYDFNDEFVLLRFAHDMIKYADYLEGKYELSQDGENIKYNSTETLTLHKDKLKK